MPAPETPKRTAGRPTELLRWTVERAAAEFGADRKTITKRLRAASIEPGADGRYSTADLFRALAGDNARDEVAREQAENFRLKNQELRGERIPKADVLDAWKGLLQNFAAALKSAKGKTLTPELINELFGQLREGAKVC